MKELIYEDTPQYDFWLKAILGGILAVTFFLGVVFLFENITAAWVMFGVTLFDALLFKVILPRRFKIFQDRLKIVLGGPLALNIPLSNIKCARLASGSKAFIYWGLRFATSTQGVVEIVRKQGLSLVISPKNTSMFLEQVDQALSTASDSSRH